MRYFTIKELTASATAIRKKIDNTPTTDIMVNLIDLVEAILDPLREWYGKPIYINSGYRCKALNKAVGGARNSQHTKGQAVDFDTRSKKDNEKLFNYIKDNMEFDQLIDEKNYSWIHVSYNKKYNRKQVLHLC